MSSLTSTADGTQVTVRRGVKAFVTAADRVLLIKETHSDGSQFWTLPGGGVESTESRATALHRELSEELRCQATIDDEQATFWYAHASSENQITLYTVFDCRLVSPPIPNGTEGILDKRWVAPEELPSSTLLPVRHVIERLMCSQTG